MNTPEKGAALKKLIKELGEDLKPEVDRIEAKIATTQNRYGDYMALLSVLCKDMDINYAKTVGLGLMMAGANVQGVRDAVKALYGE